MGHGWIKSICKFKCDPTPLTAEPRLTRREFTIKLSYHPDLNAIGYLAANDECPRITSSSAVAPTRDGVFSFLRCKPNYIWNIT